MPGWARPVRIFCSSPFSASIDRPILCSAGLWISGIVGATITFDEAIMRNLQVMDATAFALCRDQKLPIKVFSINKPGALQRVVLGEDEGTLVHV